ncbi:Mucin-13 [Apodemus speciosus]|uniref:Mucin-13 n=1 Tax=Apodemus speciosus TaxID=105296 RepID=A0ABQ0FLV1_APOSI
MGIDNDPPENLANETRDSSVLPSVTTKSDKKSGTIQTTGNSPQTPGTSQSPSGSSSSMVTCSTNSPTVGLTLSTGGSSQTSGSIQSPSSANTPTTGQTSPSGGSSQTSGSTQPPSSANSPTTGQTSPSGGSSQTSGSTQPPSSANTPATGQTSPSGGSSQTSGSTQPPSSANTPVTGQTSPSGASSQTSGPTQSPSSANTPATEQTSPSGGSSQTSGPTQPPGGAGSSTVTSTGPSDPCNPNPCEEPASCVRLHDSHFCLCIEGYYYDKSVSPSCVKAERHSWRDWHELTGTADLENKTSENYQKLYESVVDFFAKAFDKLDYGQTVILKVGTSTAPSMSARSATVVYVSVVNLFSKDTTEIEYSVSLAIHNAIGDDKGTNVTSYFSLNLCDYYGCVRNGSFCEDGLQCPCKPGLERVNPQVPFCVAVTCSEPCNAEDKKQCIKTNSGPMECVCMPGYQRASGTGNCEECPFGYSGVECKDQFQLILTIVGTVAGALILILLIAFIVTVRSKNKKKKVEEQKLKEEDLHNLRVRQTSFSNYGAENSIFPKVRTGVRNQTPNPAMHAWR